KDVATVSVGEQPRLGLVGKDHQDDVVEGIVLLRRGEIPEETLARVREKVAEVNGSILPNGATVTPYYDRMDLIKTTTHTVLKNLTEGMVLVVLILLLFLGNIRSALIVAVTIPLSLLCAFILMHHNGIPANLLSLGAVDFGIIVDAAVIMVENIFRHLAEKRQNSEAAEATLFSAIQEVQRPIFLSTSIIVAAYIPLFAMKGIEGRIFTPMAYTMGFALIAALILSMTLAPVLSSFFLTKGPLHERTVVMTPIRRVFMPLLRLMLVRRGIVLLGAFALLIFGLILIPRIGTEFMPTLEEGNIWLRTTLPASINLPSASRQVHQTREMLLEFPEVKTVISQLGRPDDGTDASGFFNAEYGIYLHPPSLWRSGMTKEKIVEEMENKLKVFPGIGYNFSQYIQDNVQEAVSGVKGANVAKLYGPDLNVLEKNAKEVVSALRSVPGIEDVGVFKELGQPELAIEIDRDRSARYGINVADIENIIQVAVGGQTATQVLEGERRHDVIVRWLPKYREEVDSIANILIDTSDGQRIPLSAVAKISFRTGPSFIYREAHSRYIPIKFSVRGRDLGGTIAEAQGRVASRVHLPFGYRIDWSGEFGEMKAAQGRLLVTVPLSLAVILLLLYTNFNSVKNTLLVFTTIPLALVGGIFTLAVTGMPLSISAAIGFISLFGIAVLDGVILITYLEQLRQEGLSLEEAIIQGVNLRLRPVLMTALLAALGLLPAALSNGIGAQAQKPLAVVIVGGLLFTTFLTLFVLPLIYQAVEELILRLKAAKPVWVNEEGKGG
ncbi:MAG TPA: CusA/CzcA family heavy metal efflux RND transporter, partial [Candidatus Manganitrophaceae bacterium]|nr:CusA/CzcA family heavy metal efflux RND transporter [Candidatus Manganitrophaceae bacterium]